ncbi:MAG: YifB family Mg chelatase-like AAA ATPase [Myxococcota bacterium]
MSLPPVPVERWMLVRTCGATLQGVEGISVRVEVDSGRGLPAFHIVGRGDRVVAEGRDRIRAAFRQAGLEFPPGRVTVNLAPTDVPKSGAGLDLAVAVAIAATRLTVDPARLDRTLFVGELGLDGRVRRVAGTLALVSTAGAAIDQAVVAAECVDEAAVCPRLRSLGAARLGDAVEWLRGGAPLEVGRRAAATPAAAAAAPDLSEVRGQERARRALEIAAAGGHNLALVGPPGSGKTLLARRLPGLLPDLDFEAALEVTRIHGIAGASSVGGAGLIVRPPFRAPHHSVSDAGMLGGGQPLRPGEISLAHRGVLFLDELPEFRRGTLEALRQPLEEGEIRLVRARGALRLPARFQWIVARNPCPCGYRGDALHECSCEEAQIRRYRARLSGPLLDRIDLRVSVPRVEWRELAKGGASEPSARVRSRIEAARDFARARGGAGEAPALPAGPLELARALDPEGRRLLERAVDGLGLSLRGVARAMRVARTIADLAASRPIERSHVAEALAYREA